MEMPSHGVPPVVHHYENEASPFALPLDWGPLFAHGLRQLHRPWFKGLNRTHERTNFFSSSSCLSTQSMVTSLLTNVLVRLFWMEDRENVQKCWRTFIFKCFFFPLPHFQRYCCRQNVNALFPEDCVHMCLHCLSPSWVLWVIQPQSATDCMTSGLVSQISYGLSNTFIFLFSSSVHFPFPLIKWANAGMDLLLCMRVDKRLDWPIRRLCLTFSLPASFCDVTNSLSKKSIPSVSAHHIPLDMTVYCYLSLFVYFESVY